MSITRTNLDGGVVQWDFPAGEAGMRTDQAARLTYTPGETYPWSLALTSVLPTNDTPDAIDQLLVANGEAIT